MTPPAHAAELPTMPLTIGTHKLIAEVATTPDQRSVGLMNRFSLKPDHGMLFVFERNEPLSFWMKNTYIPLSIAFIAPDGRIVNIEDMKPQTERDALVARARAVRARDEEGLVRRARHRARCSC